ncbi:MAG TPA: MFS transporter, partial [Armatimonadota bacterium]|nr:MFS transporter [Armatimonadota bacterium]
MTVAILCGFLPSVLLSPFAGVWADRYNRKILIILSDSLIALATLILAILFLLGYKSVWLLFLISAIRALGSGVQSPAVGAFLPQLVPEEKLTRMNATNSSIQSLVMLISPMLSGALLAMASIEAIFFIDVVTAAIAVSVLLFALRVPAHAKAREKQAVSYFTDMREGFLYVKNHSFVKTLCWFNAFFCVLIAPAAFLTPLQVSRTFGNAVWRLSAVEIAYSFGMMVGSALIASWGGLKNKVQMMALANMAISLCTFALGVTPNFWFYLAFMWIIGVAVPVFNTPCTVLLQQKVEGDFLGRVFGVLGMIASMMPMGMLLFGPVADVIKIEWLLIGTGLLLLLHSLLMLGNKVLLDAGKPIPQGE